MRLMSAKRIVTLVMGLTVVLCGVALLFLPGPGIAIIVGGLAILATEFLWAKRWLRRLQRDAVNMSSKIVSEETLKKALGEDFVNNSRKEVAVDANESQPNGSHEAAVPEPAPLAANNEPKSEQDCKDSPTETNLELAEKFPETTATGRPN